MENNKEEASQDQLAEELLQSAASSKNEAVTRQQKTERAVNATPTEGSLAKSFFADLQKRQQTVYDGTIATAYGGVLLNLNRSKYGADHEFAVVQQNTEEAQMQIANYINIGYAEVPNSVLEQMGVPMASITGLKLKVLAIGKQAIENYRQQIYNQVTQRESSPQVISEGAVTLNVEKTNQPYEGGYPFIGNK